MIDEVLARVFGGFFRTMASVFGMIAVITSQAPAFLFVLVPVLFVYKQVQSWVSVWLPPLALSKLTPCA